MKNVHDGLGIKNKNNFKLNIWHTLQNNKLKNIKWLKEKILTNMDI